MPARRRQQHFSPEYVEKRRQAALDRGLGEKMAVARAAKKAKQTGE